MAKLQYTQSLSDPCVYFKRAADMFSSLAVVVDDILHVASSDNVLAVFAAQMGVTYKLKNLDQSVLMVGIKVDVTVTTIRLM